MSIKQRNIHSDYRLIGVYASAAAYLAARNESAAAEGDAYYDTTLNQLRTYDGSSWSAAGQNSLTAGSLSDAASVGTKITIGSGFSGGIEIEATDTYIGTNGQLLLLDNNDTGSDVHCLELTNAGTAASIQITGTGSGTDINGTSDTWSVSEAGLGTFAGVDLVDDKYLRFGSSQDITLVWDQTKFIINAAAANSVVQFGAANYNVDLVVYGDTTTDVITFDTSAEDVQFNGFDLTLQDDDILNFGDSDDVTITWDQSKLVIEAAAADSAISIGKTNNLDLVIYGDTSTDAITFDTSAEDVQFNGFDLTLQDDDILNFGDSDDIKMTWDQSKFNITTVAADTGLVIGGTAYGFDMTYYFETSGTITTDYDGKLLICDGVDIRMNDDDYLLFGDSATGGSGDAYMYWDQTNLKLDCATGRFQIDTDVQIGTQTSDEENLTVYGNLTVSGNFTHTGSYSPSSLALGDSEALQLGDATGGDVSLTWDAANLLIEAAADNTGQIRIGSTNAIDLSIYGSTATKIALWDVSSAILELNDWDVHLQDDDSLQFGDATGGDVSIVWDKTNLLIEAAADDTGQIKIGATNAIDLAIYDSSAAKLALFDVSTAIIELNGWDINLQDDDILQFGDSNDITMTWDQTKLVIDGAAADVAIAVGITNNLDLIIYGDTSTDAITFDTSAESCAFNGFDLTLQDDDILKFGDSADVTITWDQTNLNIAAAAIDTPLKIGGATYGFDLTYYFETAGTIALDYDGDSMTFSDDMYLKFGSSADITIGWDQNRLLVDGAAADTAIWVGYANNQDVVIYGDTTTDTITIDTSAESVALNGFDLTLQDDDILKFGDAGTSDCYITWDQTRLQVVPSSAVFIGDKTNYTSIDASGDISMTGTASITCGNGDTTNFNGLIIPGHASSSPSGAPSGAAIWFEQDASKLWAYNVAATGWVGTVLS